MRELFIYYRVRAADAREAQAAVSQLHAQLCGTYPRLNARLLRRPAEENGSQTWMETYASPDGISDAMQTRIESEALVMAPLIDGPRHIEVFVACAS